MSFVEQQYYRQPQLPEGLFMIEDQNGDVDGPYDPADFVSDEYGVTMHQGDAAHPLFLRVINQEGNTITVVDGEGTTWDYTLIPLASSTSSPS